MDRTGNDWIQKRKKQFEETGFKSLFLDINEDDDEIILKVQNFIHNGLKVTNIRKNLDKRHLKGLERDGEYIKLYDIRLQEGANVFFAGRIGTHNCGSAIAASSVVSEWVKGKKIDDVSITNHEIATHLNLPPVKLHCSMLAEDAIKSAIEDYKEKNKN
jgi:NifU-like protein involved in Fe-S cluster formation